MMHNDKGLGHRRSARLPDRCIDHDMVLDEDGNCVACDSEEEADRWYDDLRDRMMLKEPPYDT